MNRQAHISRYSSWFFQMFYDWKISFWYIANGVEYWNATGIVAPASNKYDRDEKKRSGYRYIKKNTTTGFCYGVKDHSWRPYWVVIFTQLDNFIQSHARSATIEILIDWTRLVVRHLFHIKLLFFKAYRLSRKKTNICNITGQFFYLLTYLARYMPVANVNHHWVECKIVFI